ncbi:MAG: DUF2779 domain-containing protein [Geobacteraceae bacterium]|nr:DUF2779 domain-containing protein [Geobacteraceae bacterium]
MNDNIRPVSSYLSKSLYIRGRQCHKSLWLHKHSPELKDEVSESQDALFATGFAVGDLAQELFPGGVEVPYDGLSHDEQVERTRTLMAERTATIYEATFLHDAIFVKADILHHGPRGWELYEVKASTGVKDYHIYDAALQLHVLRGAGIEPVRVSIIHVNNSYVRSGELDLRQLFTIEDITVQVKELQPLVPQEIIAQRAMLVGDMPAIGIGPHCDDPYECDFSGHCWRNIPEDSVFDLRGRGADRFALYREGIVRQADIPLDMLNDAQRIQVESTLLERDSIDREGVKEFLDSINYPLCFLDFETFMEPIPSFDGIRPYQQVPFQFSLHIQHEPGGEVEHHGFLGEPGSDPRAELLKMLLRLIPGASCIIAWNQSFEIRVLDGLAEMFPAHRDRIEQMIANFCDLMVPFRNRTIYLWRTKGSYSIKEVLPAFVPELTYDGLEIADGGAAMDAWHIMNSANDSVELARVRTALWEYCKLDTLAMVRILEKMGTL